MALFGGGSKSPLKRLQDGAYENPEELQALVAALAEQALKMPELIGLLAHREKSVRDLAAKRIIEAKNIEVLPLLLKAMEGKPPAVQRLMASVIGQFPPAIVLEKVEPMLHHKDAGLRRAAIEIICRIPFGEAQDLLIKLIDNPDPGVRMRASQRVIAEEKVLFDPQHGDVVVKLATATDERVRMAVLEALRGKDLPISLEMFTSAFREDPSPRVTEIVMEYLGKKAAAGDQKTREVLIPMLSEGDPHVRVNVIKLLVTFPDKTEVIREAIMYSKSLAGWVWQRALESLREFGPGLIEPLMSLLEDRDEDIRASCLVLATEFNDPRLFAPIVRLVQDEDWWVRLTAVEVLGKIGNKDAVGALVKALDDEDLRWTVVDALTQLGDIKALEHIARFLNDPAPEVRLEVIKAFEAFGDERVAKMLEKCAAEDPVMEVRQRAAAVKRAIVGGDEDESLMDQDKAIALGGKDLGRLDLMLREIRSQGASDLHIKPGLPPKMRLNGTLKLMEEEEVLTAEDIAEMLKDILTERQAKMYEEDFQLDFCYSVEEVGRYRANIYQDRIGPGGVFRVIPNTIPTFSDLRIPEHLKDLALIHQGLVLVAGPASSGKSTTLAALVNLFNEVKRSHILSIEDPIEFVHPFKNSLINQREVGKHTQSFHAALKGALREDPDVIVVGEMRDAETMESAIEASETGHLVVATLHTTRAAKTIDRLIQSFPPGQQGQIRMMLSESLKAILCQSLLPKADGSGRVACFEILLGGGQLANLIRDDKGMQIPSLMQTSQAKGMRTVDMALKDLLHQDLISPRIAYNRSERKEDFESMLPPDDLAEIREAQGVRDPE